MSITYDASLKCFHLSNDRISYIFRLAGGKYPLHVYWGKRVPDDSVSTDLNTGHFAMVTMKDR